MGKNHCMPWTKEQMIKLATSYIEGDTWEDIEKSQGRSKSACKSRIAVLKLACSLVKNAEEVLDILSQPREANGQKA